MNGFYKYLESKEVKDIRNLLVFMMLALILLSCARRGVQLPDSTHSAANPSQVNIIREARFFGLGLSLTVMFDNKDLCSLKTGEYVTFEVEPGLHTLGLSESTITVLLVPKGKYYFLIKTSADKFGFEIERIDDEIGNHFVANSKVVE